MIDSIWEAVDMVTDRLETQSGPLGLRYVGKYDEQIIPEYPAVVVVPGPRGKVIHGLRTYNVALRLDLYIYHANITMTKRERSKADLQLVSLIEQELEKDLRWNGNLIHAYVSSEEPGVLQPRANKSTMVICTRLTWTAMTQRRF